MRSLCYFVPGLLCLSIFLITSAFDCEPNVEESVVRSENNLVSNDEINPEETIDFSELN